MITAIELENFRSFGERVRIPLAPITLVLGQNSAGKSSILHALSLLKQSAETHAPNVALLPRAEGGVVDLGSYSELLYDHDIKRPLKIRLEIEANTERYKEYLPLAGRFRRSVGTAVIGLEQEFGLDSGSGDVVLKRLHLVREGDPAPLCSFKRVPEPVSPFLRQRQWVLSCSAVTDREDIWRPIYADWLRNRRRVARTLQHFDWREFERASRISLATTSGTSSGTSVERWVHEALSFYSAEFTFESFRDRMLGGLRSLVVGVGQGLPRQTVYYRAGLPEFALAESPRGYMKVGLGDGGRLPMFDLELMVRHAAVVIEKDLETLFPFGPWRRPPQRWYVYAGVRPHSVGYQGEMLTDLLYRSPQVLTKTNEWLRRLDVGHEIKLVPLGARADLYEVRVMDVRRRTKTEVALPDVGYGVSQLLPFVVQSLSAQQRLISIEQPEVHVHPKLQAELGELLAHAIREPYGHRFLVETHSEHLVLRLQRLIRQRVLGPSELALLFVARTAEGSAVHRIHLDRCGEFADEWPGGFFPERLQEVL